MGLNKENEELLTSRLREWHLLDPACKVSKCRKRQLNFANFFTLSQRHKKGIVWGTNRQACLLCPWARHPSECLYLCGADRWPARTSPGYNCEVANPECCKRRLLGTHQWQSALVVGLPVIHDWLEMGCHLSPSLISIRLTA